MLWVHIAAQDLGRELDAVAKQRNVEWICPPSILLELLRRPPEHDPDNATVNLYAQGSRRRRLSSEAEYESSEVIGVIRRRRPRWLRRKVDRQEWQFWHEYWIRKVWRDARTHPVEMHEHVRATYEDDSVFEVQKEQQRAAREQDFRFKDASTLKAVPQDTSTRQPWPRSDDGELLPVDGWRAVTLSGLQEWLFAAPRVGYSDLMAKTMRSWIGCYADIDAIRQEPESFTRLWLEEVDVTEVPRWWTRFAVEYTQLEFKVERSGGRDNQHSAHLVDCDYFMSRDRRFITICHEVVRQAPVDLAIPVRLDFAEDSDVVTAIDEALG